MLQCGQEGVMHKLYCRDSIMLTLPANVKILHRIHVFTPCDLRVCPTRAQHNMT